MYHESKTFGDVVYGQADYPFYDMDHFILSLQAAFSMKLVGSSQKNHPKDTIFLLLLWSFVL